MRFSEISTTTTLLALLLVACGDGAGITPIAKSDAGTPAADGGAPAPDAGGPVEPGPLSFTNLDELHTEVILESPSGSVFEGGIVAPGASTEFEDAPAGSRLSALSTESDEDGETRFLVLSYPGVGQDEAIGGSPTGAPPQDSEIGVIRVTIPALPDGATAFKITNGCDSTEFLTSTSPKRLDARARCGVKQNILGVAVDADGRPVAYSFLLDVEAAGEPNVSLPAWRDGVPVRFNGLGAPPASDGYQLAISTRIGSTEYQIVRYGGAFTDGGFSEGISLPAEFGEVAYQVGVFRGNDFQSEAGFTTVQQLGNVTVDLSRLPPFIDIQGLAEEPDGTVVLRMQARGSVDHLDGYIVSIATGGGSIVWTAVTPATAGDIRLPPLPAAYSDYRMRPSQRPSIQIVAVDSSAYETVAEFRAGAVDPSNRPSPGSTFRRSASSRFF